MTPSQMSITQLLFHCICQYRPLFNPSMSNADLASTLTNWMYFNGGDNTCRLLEHFGNGEKLEPAILKMLDNPPKVTYTLQIIPRSKYGPKSGHLLQDGTIGAGFVREFKNKDEAISAGNLIPSSYKVYLETNTLYSEKEDDWETVVSEKPL